MTEVVQGFCAPQFAQVRDEFEKLMRIPAEQGASVEMRLAAGRAVGSARVARPTSDP